MPLHDEVQNLISGIGSITERSLISAIADYLRKSTPAGYGVKEKELVKEQEAQAIIAYARQHSLFYSGIDDSRYLAEGAEQKVYLADDNVNVIKLNDAIFYLTWSDYFLSLLLHNYFFPATAYELLGFHRQSEILFAVVKQPYILSDAPTDLEAVKTFMLQNGFVNTKNEDYKNIQLGIILEDLHDENVLTNKGILFFIDTVFYVIRSSR